MRPLPPTRGLFAIRFVQPLEINLVKKNNNPFSPTCGHYTVLSHQARKDKEREVTKLDDLS